MKGTLFSAHPRGRAGGCWHNERGLTLVELMIATTIAVLATAGAWMVYSSQQLEFARQRMVSEMDHSARTVTNDMAKRIRLARVGSDPEDALRTACACQISFDSNRRGVYTFLPMTSGLTPTIQVNSTAGFAVGDTVSLTSWTVPLNPNLQWQVRTIQEILAGPPRLRLDQALLNVMPIGSLQTGFPQGSGVFQTFRTTFALHLTQRQLLQNNSLALATNVLMNANGYPPAPAGGDGPPLFSYFDRNNNPLNPTAGATCLTTCLTFGQRSMVREVSISLSLQSQGVTNVVAKTRSSVTHQTGVKLRMPSPS